MSIKGLSQVSPQSPAKPLVSYSDSSTSIRVEPSSTRETRQQGAHGDSLLNP
jgi:hypothetical protein